MTGTMAWLEAYSSAGAALSLIIEGTDTVYATSALPNTFSSDGAPYSAWADPTIGSLLAKGVIKNQIELYAQDIKADQLEFTISDKEGTLIGTLLREAYSSGLKTYITSSVLAGSTAPIDVKPIATFPTSGTIYIGDEAIGYTTTSVDGAGKTTQFNGTITRGKYVVNRTNGGTNFAPSHIIGNNVVASATTAPAVTNYPRTWYGRFCHLLLHVKDPLRGVYNLPSEAFKIWSGRLQAYSDDGDGKITLTATSAVDVLNRAVGTEQWHGKVHEGFVFTAEHSPIYVHNSAAVAYSPSATLSVTGRKSHSDIATLINAQFEAWRSGGSLHSGDLFDIGLADPGDGSAPRYRIRLRANTTTVGPSESVRIYLHDLVWQLLGWPHSDSSQDTGTGYRVVRRELNRHTGNDWELMAPQSPVLYQSHGWAWGATLHVNGQVGTFGTQASSEIAGATAQTNGVVQIKGGEREGVYAVKYTAGSPDATLLLQGRLDLATGSFLAPEFGPAEHLAFVRMGDDPEPPTVTQVWFKSGPASQLLLEALLSSGGASGYNHSTYDVVTAPGFGAAVPASLVDVASWEELDDVQMQLLVTDPLPFYKHLEPVLAVSNRYVVWRASSASTQPKLTIVRPKLDTSADIDWALTESNKAGAVQGNPDRTRVSRGVDGVINRAVVQYGQGLQASLQPKTWTIEDIASQSDYGRKRTITIKAPSITNVETLAPKALGPALGYFSRPLAVAERSYNASLARMAPGDSVSVTDNYLVNPETGARGAILYGWVLATSFDLATGRGVCRIVFLPEKFPRVVKWAPSARVDEGAAGAGYNAGTKTLTLKQHEFSLATELADPLNFGAGDYVHIYALDEDPPLEWFDRLNGGPSATTMLLTTGLAGFDTTKRYVVEFDDIATVQTSQRARAFIADDADNSTGGAITTPYDWGSQGTIRDGAATIDYTHGVLKPSGTDPDKGEPMSVHKAVYAAKGANNLLAYKTRNVYLSLYFTTAGAQTGTTPKMLFLGWIPFYGHHGSHGVRDLLVRLRGKQTGGGTATFTVRSMNVRPSGISFTSYAHPAGETNVAFATTSATPAWSSELVLAASIAPAAGGSQGLYGTWIMVEAVGSAGGITATLDSLWIAEAALT